MSGFRPSSAQFLTHRLVASGLTTASSMAKWRARFIRLWMTLTECSSTWAFAVSSAPSGASGSTRRSCSNCSPNRSRAARTSRRRRSSRWSSSARRWVCEVSFADGVRPTAMGRISSFTVMAPAEGRWGSGLANGEWERLGELKSFPSPGVDSSISSSSSSSSSPSSPSSPSSSSSWSSSSSSSSSESSSSSSRSKSIAAPWRSDSSKASSKSKPSSKRSTFAVRGTCSEETATWAAS
ncbi:unnamed protein product [Chondrus crispus]|uniref:Uncharacterized protein n=1 Tax=Chondrus crispus TaxID=2769 RepID=R7QKG6_CHOCR|nr:unnamed protein product [Chondrus crispus]CDF38564.1 unnamed protein product [Chondrus crispus]|eukprot:XP_005718469.1 unnamed protein product [Chondrus crispus]